MRRTQDHLGHSFPRAGLANDALLQAVLGLIHEAHAPSRGWSTPGVASRSRGGQRRDRSIPPATLGNLAAPAPVSTGPVPQEVQWTSPM